MKRILLAAALVALTSPAYAGSCPTNWPSIDTALQTAKLDAAKTAEVKKLRADSEAKHKAGDHAGALSDIQKAKAVLNIK